jgi:membrane protease YdiL (CAAX protease family)
MDEIKALILLQIGLWSAGTGLVLAFGQRWPRLRGFRTCMLEQWKPALGISLLYLLATGLGGRSLVNPYALAVFCEAMVGLALARGISGFEPLPVVQTFFARKGRLKEIGLVLLYAFLGAVVGIILGSVGLSIAQSIFHETYQTSGLTQNFAPGFWQAFWLFLAGAGIAEETLYRLVLVSLFWRLTGRSGWAVILSALVFGIYHLTPLSGMYRTFWQFPISQFLASVLIGLVWGWLFVRRGYGTSVLAHTLSNWLPMALL